MIPELAATRNPPRSSSTRTAPTVARARGAPTDTVTSTTVGVLSQGGQSLCEPKKSETGVGLVGKPPGELRPVEHSRHVLGESLEKAPIRLRPLGRTRHRSVWRSPPARVLLSRRNHHQRAKAHARGERPKLRILLDREIGAGDARLELAIVNHRGGKTRTLVEAGDFVRGELRAKPIDAPRVFLVSDDPRRLERAAERGRRRGPKIVFALKRTQLLGHLPEKGVLPRLFPRAPRALALVQERRFELGPGAARPSPEDEEPENEEREDNDGECPGRSWTHDVLERFRTV